MLAIKIQKLYTAIVACCNNERSRLQGMVKDVKIKATTRMSLGKHKHTMKSSSSTLTSLRSTQYACACVLEISVIAIRENRPSGTPPDKSLATYLRTPVFSFLLLNN